MSQIELPDPGRPLRRPGRRTLLPTVRAVVALMLREMSTTYGRSPGGYLWAVIEPIAAISALVAIFSLGLRMRQPGLGDSFAVFYAIGVVAFMMYANTSTKVSQAVTFSRQLLAYPRVTWADAIIARFLMTFVTQMMVTYVVIGGVLILFDEPVVILLPEIATALALVALLGLGIGTFNCFMVSMFPVWRNVWGIVSRPLWIVSGVIFLYDSFPEPWRGWLWWNPLVHPIGLMRAGFYPGYDAPYVSIAYPAGVALVALAVGLLLLRRFHREVLER